MFPVIGYTQRENSQSEKIDEAVKAINALPCKVKLYPYTNKCGVIKVLTVILQHHREIFDTVV